MNKGYKFIAIAIVALFLGMVLNSANAQVLESKSSENNDIEFNTKTEENTVEIEIGNINDDGTIETEVFTLSESEFEELQSVLSKISEEIEYATDIEQVKCILHGFLWKFDSPIIYLIHVIIWKVLDLIDGPYSRDFVISHGWGYKFRPFRHSEFDICRPLTIWHYGSRSILASRSIILRLFPFEMKVLKNSQLGMMLYFKGIYLYVARQIPQMSYTFFMGIARHACGFDLQRSPFIIR